MSATTDAEAEQGSPRRKGSRKPLLIGVLLALLGGGVGFYAVSSGLLGGAGHSATEEAEAAAPVIAEGPKVAFVPLEPLVISLPAATGQVLLRFRAELEVAPGTEEDVRQVLPRIVDVLNGYLRAVSLEELRDPAVLTRLRGQMLRRVQVVAGADRVRDLLIMEFVLN